MNNLLTNLSDSSGPCKACQRTDLEDSFRRTRGRTRRTALDGRSKLAVGSCHDSSSPSAWPKHATEKGRTFGIGLAFFCSGNGGSPCDRCS